MPSFFRCSPKIPVMKSCACGVYQVGSWLRGQRMYWREMPICCVACAFLALLASGCERRDDAPPSKPRPILLEQGSTSPVALGKKGWHFSTVDSSGFTWGYACSIGAGVAGGPHIFYQGRGKGDRPMVSGDFQHASLRERTWRKEIVDRDCSVFGNIYPAFGRSGAPHLLYQVFNTRGRDGLKYAYRRNHVWEKQDIYGKEISAAEMKRRFDVTSFSLGLMVTYNFCLTIDGRDRLHLAPLKSPRANV